MGKPKIVGADWVDGDYQDPINLLGQSAKEEIWAYMERVNDGKVRRMAWEMIRLGIDLEKTTCEGVWEGLISNPVVSEPLVLE